jgi:hypothetical protein
MTPSGYGRAGWRAIVIQFLILLGLFALYRVYLPYHERDLARRTTAEREQKINAFFQDAVMVDPTREISVPVDGAMVKRHPQKLRLTFSPPEAESKLGVPDASTTDFGGGQHLTWLGKTHKLEASFNSGHLYCLALEDRATGHGVLVYESPESWHPY